MVESERCVLVIDDNEEILQSVQEVLQHEGYQCHTATSGEEALRRLGEIQPGLIITDLEFPAGMNGLEFIQKARETAPATSSAVITGHSTVESAIQALRIGVFDYLTKPFDPEELTALVERIFAFRELETENVELRQQLATQEGDSPLVMGSSLAMQRVMGVVRAVAPMPTSVLIRGESGTGKEVIADEIHRLSPRADKPNIKVNCAALPETLLEDELFGHEKGSFTGASDKRAGRFEEADGGTIFLDEIGEMSPLLQAKLLRVLQERQFQRIGSNKTIDIDVRVICATNKDLEKAVAEGDFREDLYYRINVVQVELPPLRERKDDIPILAKALGQTLARRLGIPRKNFSPEALAVLQEMDFPGNVRELMNLLERVLIFSRGPTIGPTDVSGVTGSMPDAILASPPPASSPDDADAPAEEGGLAIAPVSLAGVTLEELEREAIRQTLADTDGNMYQTAKRLGISRSTLYSKVKKLGLEPKAEVTDK